MNEQQKEAHTSFVIERTRPWANEAQELLGRWMEGEDWDYLYDSRLHHVLTVLLGHVEENPYGFSKWQTNYRMLGAAIEAGNAMRSLDEAKVRHVEVSRFTMTEDGQHYIWIDEDGDVCILLTNESGRAIVSTSPEVIIERLPELAKMDDGLDPRQFSGRVPPFSGLDGHMIDKIIHDSKWHNKLKRRVLRGVAAILKIK